MEDLSIRALIEKHEKITSNELKADNNFEEILSDFLRDNLDSIEEFYTDGFDFDNRSEEDRDFYNICVYNGENNEVLNAVKTWANKVKINNRSLNVIYIDATDPHFDFNQFRKFPSVVVFGNLETKAGAENAIKLIALIHDLYRSRYSENDIRKEYDNVLYFIGIGGISTSADYEPLCLSDKERFTSYNYPNNK